MFRMGQENLLHLLSYQCTSGYKVNKLSCVYINIYIFLFFSSFVQFGLPLL